MWHGCLEGDAFRGAWLRLAADLVGRSGIETGMVSFAAARESRIDTLADALEEHLDLDAVLRLVEHGAPPASHWSWAAWSGELRGTRSGRLGAKRRSPPCHNDPGQVAPRPMVLERG